MCKRNVKVVVALLLICIMSLMVSSCVMNLNGTYTNDDGIVKQSFTFKEDNQVAVSAFGIDITGEYLIEDDTITITYSLLSLSYDWEKPFEKKGDSIFIDGVEFIKE